MDKKDERQFSASMLCDDYMVVDSVPMCNGCKRWHAGSDKCDKYPRGIPKSFRYEELHNCDRFELNPDDEINYKYVKANLERRGSNN